MILDANERVGDAWRKRWDSLRLFTPARYSGLPGMPFPGPAHSFPTKDEVADYLEAYATRFDLPVRTGTRVDRLSRNGDGFAVAAGDLQFEAENVVVAMATDQLPWVPPFAPELDPGVVQLHSRDYRNPAQLQEGDVLVVGAGNSGAEIALDVASGHRTCLSGTPVEGRPRRVASLRRGTGLEERSSRRSSRQRLSYRWNTRAPQHPGWMFPEQLRGQEGWVKVATYVRLSRSVSARTRPA